MTYFEYLCDLVDIHPGSYKEDYSLLAYQLYSKEYYYLLPLDENRASDGKNLRIIFKDKCASEERVSDDLIVRYEANTCPSQDEPARVLEVLIALAQRCDRDILYDNNLGDRTSDWFWMFLNNIGLDIFKNGKMDEPAVDYILNTWLDRDIGYNGENGLFPLSDAETNQKEVDLWYQMMTFLTEKDV